MSPSVSKTTNEMASEFVYYRTYSRWVPELNRRENYEETVQRYISFLKDQFKDKNVPKKVYQKIEEGMLSKTVMPSMRALWSAGDSLRYENVSGYNCSFLAVDSIDAFAECLYILCCGTGVGFSVERKYTEQLPEVPLVIMPSNVNHVVPDSKEGWAESVKIQMENLYSGNEISFDYSKIRPAGSRLKLFGGRASGPGPLISLHAYIKDTFYAARGRKLNTLECHDIMNEIAQIVVAGGTRRSSEISLSDLDDDLMRNAKLGNFPVRRYMANNSAVFLDKPTSTEFLKEWTALALSGSGERGIFNLGGARKNAPERRDAGKIVGINPCSEVVLRNTAFCNLSEVVIRTDDDLDSLLEKVETATWIGALQSCLTKFNFLRDSWKKNCEEERLLGVSLTGQMDVPQLITSDNLKALKSRAIKVARKASKLLEINMPAAITLVKPSGTVSQLIDSSSGIHPRFAKFYIRRYRIAAVDPLCRMMMTQGIALSPENGQRQKDWNKAAKEADIQKAKSICPIYDPAIEKWSKDLVNTWILSFPIKSPKGSITSDQVSAIDQLEMYKKVQTNWCEHNTSITIYVKPDEWIKVGNWVYENWDIVNGLSFIPYQDHIYEQAPYEAITEIEYKELVEKFKSIDYSKLSQFETEDETQGSKEYACVGGSCDI